MALFLITAGALALLVLGLSITLIRKGHDIEGDVGDNRHMKALGLQCTMQQFTDGEVVCHSGGGGAGGARSCNAKHRMATKNGNLDEVENSIDCSKKSCASCDSH